MAAPSSSAVIAPFSEIRAGEWVTGGCWHVPQCHCARLSLLEPSCRSRGCGTEAVLMMLAYGKSMAPPTPTLDPDVGISLFGPKWGFRRSSFISLPFCFLGGMSKLGLTTFEAKIGQENEQSMGLFRKLHFEQVRSRLLRCGCRLVDVGLILIHGHVMS